MPTSARPHAQKAFDYTGLKPEISEFVQQQTDEIQALVKRTAQDIIEIGQKLIEVKAKLVYGRFLEWLDVEFKWSWDTAKRFMRVAEVFGQNQQIADLYLAPSALYELAAPSTPKAARNEAIARAKAGEVITYTVAKDLKKKYKPPSTPEPEAETVSQPQPTSAPSAHIQSGSRLEIVAIRPQAKMELESKPKPELEPVSQPHLTTMLAPPPQLGSKLEIGAIRLQAPTIEAASKLVVPQAAHTPLSSQLSVEQPGIWWELGERHLLYCGDPNSTEFVGRVRGEAARVSLLIAFPPIPEWQSSIQAKNRLIASDYLPQGKSLDQLDEILEAALLFYSRLQDIVAGCFLPSPEILSVVNRQGRRGLFADPDERRCKAAIANWKKAGLKVERLD